MSIFKKKENVKESIVLTRIFVSAVFILHFIYFAFYNKYHLAYQEQIQLFRYDCEYFKEFLLKPGGISEYAGTFLMQFYLFPTIGAFIVTFLAIALFFLSKNILKKSNINSLLWHLIPVLFVTILQSDYVFYASYTIGFLISLSFYIIYLQLNNNYIRIIFFIFSIIFVYVIAGEFVILTITLILFYEFFNTQNKFMFLLVFISVALIISAHFILKNPLYLLPPDYLWLKPLIIYGNTFTRVSMLIMLAYFPVLLLLGKIWQLMFKGRQVQILMNLRLFITGLLIIISCSFLIFFYVYDYKTELLLGIDNNIQKEKWENVLKISAKAPGLNQLAVYLTNIALYKSGKLGDEMFHYNQIGTQGLFPGWGGEASPFFGNEVFYHLGYINEAHRWAFEAMVSKGQVPRLLKRLAITSIINGNYETARKFLNVLKKTLFYRKWALHYINLISNPDKTYEDEEIREKRHFLINSDFFANVNDYEGELIKLLENHPDNRMAFEYLMSSYLLRKDLLNFARNIYRLKELNYKEIPVHYEEALLMSGLTKLIPEGYSIRESTLQTFNNYIITYSTYTGTPDKLQEILFSRFGKTYFYYYQFR